MIWSFGVILAIVLSIWYACEGRVMINPNELTAAFRPTNFQSPSDASCKCGEKGTTRIVGGKEATPNEYPWQALLMSTNYYQFCGGSVIAKQWILSAAHCFMHYKVAEEILVSLGEHDYSSEDPYTRKFKVEKLIIHKKFNEGTELNNDIALLKLKTPATYDLVISPICLPFNHKDDTWTGKTGSISGWGYTIPGDVNSGSKVLKELDLKLMERTECTVPKYVWHLSQVTENMVCAITEKAGMCPGDSGGPLVWLNPDNGLYFEVGIASFVYKCADDTGPGVFAKVQMYLDWIKEKTGAGDEMCVK